MAEPSDFMEGSSSGSQTEMLSLTEAVKVAYDAESIKAAGGVPLTKRVGTLEQLIFGGAAGGGLLNRVNALEVELFGKPTHDLMVLPPGFLPTEETYDEGILEAALRIATKGNSPNAAAVATALTAALKEKKAANPKPEAPHNTPLGSPGGRSTEGGGTPVASPASHLAGVDAPLDSEEEPEVDPVSPTVSAKRDASPTKRYFRDARPNQTPYETESEATDPDMPDLIEFPELTPMDAFVRNGPRRSKRASSALTDAEMPDLIPVDSPRSSPAESDDNDNNDNNDDEAAQNSNDDDDDEEAEVAGEQDDDGEASEVGSDATDPEMPELIEMPPESPSDQAQSDLLDKKDWSALPAPLALLDSEYKEPSVDDLSNEERQAEYEFRNAASILSLFEPDEPPRENQSDFQDALKSLKYVIRFGCQQTRQEAIQICSRIWHVSKSAWLMNEVMETLAPSDQTAEDAQWSFTKSEASSWASLLILRPTWPKENKAALTRLCKKVASVDPQALVTDAFKTVPRGIGDFMGFHQLLQFCALDLVPKFEVYDRVMAMEDFQTDSKEQEKIMKGQCGWIREIDEVGDMSISFDGRFQKRQWVFRKHCFRVAPIGKAYLNESRAKEGQVYEGWELLYANNSEKTPCKFLRSQIAEHNLHGVIWHHNECFYFGHICPDGIVRGGIHSMETTEELGLFELSPAAVKSVEMYDCWTPITKGNLAGSVKIDKHKLSEEQRKKLICAQQAVVTICDDFSLEQTPNSASARVLLEKLNDAMSIKTPLTEDIATKGKLVNVLGKLEALQQLQKLDARSTE